MCRICHSDSRLFDPLSVSLALSTGTAFSRVAPQIAFSLTLTRISFTHRKRSDSKIPVDCARSAVRKAHSREVRKTIQPLLAKCQSLAPMETEHRTVIFQEARSASQMAKTTRTQRSTWLSWPETLWVDDGINRHGSRLWTGLHMTLLTCSGCHGQTGRANANIRKGSRMDILGRK